MTWRGLKNSQRTFDSLADLFSTLSDNLLRPPERLNVPAAAERYRVLNNPGSYVGPWRNATVPYMIEPQAELTSREFNALVFVAPAQAAKTDSLILNWMLYTIIVDPMDMLIFSPTMSVTRDFSTRRVDRMHRFSPEAGKRLLRERDSDNKYEKHYNSGIMISLGWPAVSQLAGRPIGRVALTDYDRMPDDVEGDGAPFDLAQKRTTTFGTFAMTVAESSPSRPLEMPNWIATSAHEAPPTKGILALYNRGDKRKLYWPCPDCGEFFEGTFRHLKWDDLGNIVDSAESVRLICPSCSAELHFDQRREMLAAAKWLKDGQGIERDGNIVGQGSRSTIASFWLNGVAAAFITWSGLVMLYMTARREFERTGSDEALKKFYNNDLGEVYVPDGQDTDLLPEVLKARAEHLPEREVPPNTRFLLATVDVQKNMFVVQVFGILPGDPFDVCVIDRFKVIKSKRTDTDGDSIWVKPGTYLQDWDLLIEDVMQKRYPLSDGSGRLMQVRMTGCDSGGREGVTTNAYAFWRKLRGEGLAGRFHLLKGDGKPGNPRARITFPDSNRRDKHAVARGDVPVVILNSNLLKDSLANRLRSLIPGKGMFRYPDWLEDDFFVELCSEQRTPKGWETPIRRRNEAWDLGYYLLGLAVSPLVRAEQIDWTRPPSWADEWDKNDLVSRPDKTERFASGARTRYDLGKFGKTLA